MSKEEPRAKVDLDDILVNDVGQFGRYQLRTLFLAAFPIIFSVFTAGEYVFTTARIPTRCHINECDGANPEFTPSWLLNAIPGTSLTSFENCERYDNATVPPTITEGICPAALFDQSSTKECESYVYENDNSVVHDFDLACDEWRRAQIGSIKMIGNLFALPITGYISDRWGRRLALSLNAFNAAWLGLVRSFMTSYEWYLAFQVIEALLGAGAYSSCYILVVEMAGPRYRVIAGAAMGSLISLAGIIMSLVAWALPAWRDLTRALYAPQLLVISYFWILSESVRWLLSKGRYDESEQILRKVAEVNKRQIPAKTFELLRATAEANRSIVPQKEPWLPILVFRSRVLLSRCIVSPIWWVTNTLIYYGLNVNAVNLVGNSYLNYVAVAAIEIPGYWVAIALLDRVGRKAVSIVGYFLCAACQLLFAFLSEDYSTARLILYLFSKSCISMMMISIYVYTAELYPTKYRHNLFAFSSMIGRVGQLVAPLTPALALTVWEPLPAVIFGGFALLSGILLFTTPETLGTKLPDTIDDAEQIGKKETSI